MIFSNSSWYCLFLLIILESNSFASAEFVLAGGSFSLTSKFASFGKDVYIQTGTLKEEYSADQSRARLQYQLPDEDYNYDLIIRDFFYDAGRQVGLSYSPEKRYCSWNQNPIESLYARLLPDSPQFHKLLSQDINHKYKLLHIVGFAKLLFLIRDHSDKMSRVEREEPKSIRNHPTVEYELEFPDSDVKLTVYYDMSEFSRNANQDTVPFSVVVNFTKLEHYISIDYFSHQVLGQSVVGSENGDFLDKGAEKLVDRFAFPVSYNCSKFLFANQLQIDLFKSYYPESAKFSFSAKSSGDYSCESFNHFVAYDGMLQTLRIDTKLNRRETNNRIRDSMILVDFRLNQKYFIVDAGVDMINFSGFQNTDLLEDNKRGKCILEPFKPLSLKNIRSGTGWFPQMLLGAPQFVYMGKGQVNGIDVSIYEAPIGQLPEWFRPQMVYQEKDGSESIRERTWPIKMGEANANKRFNLVVYVIENNDPRFGLKLVKLEVYDLTISIRSSYRKMFEINFENFVWRLSEAPNGDQVRELFELKELCSDEVRKNKYAELELLLEEDDETRLGAKDVHWIDDWSRRESAIIASVRDVLDVSRLMIYDIESKVFINKHNSRRSIKVIFRILEHPQSLYKLEFLGRANMIGYADIFVKIPALSPDECLAWYNRERRHDIFIGYSEMVHMCMIADQKWFATSGAMKMDPDASTELFKLITVSSDELTLGRTWFHDSNLANMRGRTLILQNWLDDNSASPVDFNDFRARVTLAKVKILDHMHGSSSDQLSSAGSFAGYDLPEQSAYTKTLIQDQSAANQEVSREQCHAACYADTNCQAFAYCAHSPYSKCTLSKIGFETREIRALLGSKEVGRKRGDKIQVSGMELIRDSRCELINKIYLDLFDFGFEIETFSMDGLEAYAVKSEEQCAKLCFGKSLNAIRSGAVINERIKELLNDDEDNISDNDIRCQLRELREEHRVSMNRFCQVFMYSRESLTSNQRAILGNISNLNRKEEMDKVSGEEYCILESDAVEISDDRKQMLEPQNVTFTFDSYKFNFATLYEKKHGVALVASTFDEKQLSVYYQILNDRPVKREEYDLLRGAFMSGGKNFQNLIAADERKCAKQCFLQTSALWPACRSFDVQQDILSFNCFLNTASLDSIKDENSTKPYSDYRQVWHYEPKFEFVKEDAEQVYWLESARESSAMSSIESNAGSGWFATVVIALMSLASGLALSYKGTKWLGYQI